MELNSFAAVRSRANVFVNQRDWSSFHTPTNLALALSGECGEISEILQWKGPIDNLTTALNEKDRTHLGEEIADVFIYSTRLSDVCQIDLARSVVNYLSCEGDYTKFQIQFQKAAPPNDDKAWTQLTFKNLNSELPKVPSFALHPSPRHIALSIQSTAGEICKVFAAKPENQSTTGLPLWSHLEVSKLAFALVEISLLLSGLTVFLNTTIGRCCADKFVKNEAKYPADLVKGSSAKYTEYKDKIKQRDMKTLGKRGMMMFTLCAAALALLLGGRRILLN